MVQAVTALLLSVNICNLQMEHPSAAFFISGTIVSNDNNRQVVYV